MKKIYIMMLLVLTGTMAMAQTSVWHGGRQVWTRGTGTENDPFLIESADNLAYLAYVVNKGYDTQDIYFRLTTDIDLNGSEDQQWVPIGMRDRWFSEDGCNRGVPSGFGYSPHTTFRGHFDGGEHEISNIYIDNSEEMYGSYNGLFGVAEGVMDGQDTYPAVIENVFVTSGFIKGSCCGGIVANGNGTTLVSRCWNGATVISDFGHAGGIVGDGNGAGQVPVQVYDCYNIGNISGYYTGGIVGYGNRVEIEECYNEGDISGAYAGGIFGYVYINRKATINNCYNTGSIFADGEVPSTFPAGPAAGGIASFLYRDFCAVTNCYNVGSVSSTRDAGCILACCNATLENNFYINTCDAGGEGEPLTEEYMHSQAFVDLLNGQNEEHVWALDVNHTNGGFPILINIDLTVPEITEPAFNVYPNPAQGRFMVEGTGSMRVSNVLGQTILSKEIDGKATIEIPKGLYFVQLNGMVRKIVVE